MVVVLSSKLDVALALSGLAEAARASRQAERAAQLLGAADAARLEVDLPVPEPQRSMFEQTAVAVSSVLGGQTFAELHPRGQALSREVALAYALEDMPPGVSQLAAPDARDLVQLSPREREVAALIASGLTNRGIAERLLIAERTVATHIEHIHDKLGFRSRIQVSVWATEHGIREFFTLKPELRRRDRRRRQDVGRSADVWLRIGPRDD